MLVLQRALWEGVTITGTDGNRTVVTVVKIENGHVRLGFEAVKAVTIHRNEVQAVVDREKGGAA